MSDNYVGEIRLFAGSYAPVGWHLCDGAEIEINKYSTLFALLGTTYGGNGQTTFKLPNLKTRVPVGQGAGPGLTNRTIGQQFGAAQVALTTSQMPAHSHRLCSSTSAATSAEAQGLVPAQNGDDFFYVPAPATGAQPQTMVATSVTSAGGGQAHDNMMPSMAINYIIAHEGIFPSRN